MVSQDLDQCLIDAVIDKDQLYCLTKYTTTKGVMSVKKSDHLTLLANFSISWKEEKPARHEIFKLRDENGLDEFHKVTSESRNLLKCVDENIPLEKAFEKWYREIQRIFHRCFKKIRVTNSPPKRSVDYQLFTLLSDIKTLKEMVSISTPMYKPVLLIEIAGYEEAVAEIQGKKCRRIIEEEARNMLAKDFSFKPNAAWSLKKKLFPKSAEPPFAVLNKDGQLVTDSSGILDVMKDEFTFRLRNREIDYRYKELQELKEYLCYLRLEMTKNSDFLPWELHHLQMAISKLKNNKCRDPHGHINEIYKYLGNNGLLSLLQLLNRIKYELLIPDCLRVSNVSTLYKGKGSKQDVVNLRGIFKLPIVRNILDKLISYDDREVLNKNMGQFQVGNQQGRGIRDHTLLVHAIVNEAKYNKKPIDILFTDIKQCFDSIWLEEAINDMYCSGITTRNLNLIYEGNKETDMCIDTRFGSSERVKLKKIVMQGSVSGGTICSNQLSKLCNKCFMEGKVYLYADKVPIPPLAMVDDVVSAAICNSVEALENNITTDEFIKSKKLESQVGEGKCQWVHSGCNPCLSSYKANGSELSQSLMYKYLGDTVSDEWDTLYKKRYEKAVSYAVTCQAMCTELSLGYHLYFIVKLLHQAIFINGTLVNMETWPHFNINRLCMFERAEQSLLRKILCAHSKTPVECLYLELGIIPLRFHLMARRIMYYKTIMMRDDDEITKMVVLCQMDNMIEGDFYPQVSDDMKLLKISEDDIMFSSEGALRELVKQAIDKAALKFLLDLGNTHSKVNVNLYRDMSGMKYMKDYRFSPDVVNLLFKFRTRMFNVKNNFRNNYRQTDILCPLCKSADDTQEHLFQCKVVEKSLLDGSVSSVYNDIFSEDVDKLLAVGKDLKVLTELRDELENEQIKDGREA